MKAQDLKVGSEIEIISNLSEEKMNVPMIVKIDRVSNSYIWFKYSGFQRVGINTINKYPGLYKIISID